MNEFKHGDTVRFIDNRSNLLFWKTHYKKSFGFKDIVTVELCDDPRFIVPKECRVGLCVFADRFEKVIKKGQLQLPFKGV